MDNHSQDLKEPIQVPVRIVLANGTSYEGEARYVAGWFHLKFYWFKEFQQVFDDDKQEISESQLMALMSGTSVQVKLLNLQDNVSYDQYQTVAWVHPSP